MSAARAWAAGTLLLDNTLRRHIDDDALADARKFGFDTDMLNALVRGQNGTGFSGVFSGNTHIVLAFLAVASQWRTMVLTTRAGFRSRFVGLDYAGVRVALDALAIPVTTRLWSGLTVMEQAAVVTLNGDGVSGEVVP